MNNKTRFYYDEEGDFLEISIGEPTECYAKEIKPGVIIRFDKKTDEVKSISILDFESRTNLKDIEFDLPLSFNITDLKNKSISS